MQKSFKRKIASGVIVIAMLVTMLPTTAFAASSTNVTALPTTAGSTLSSGYIYTVKSNTTITAPATGNALNVASGATVTIDIAQGYTLTVNGGSGSGRTAGGAGIYLPSNSTLIITGSGRLVANGGRSGNSIGGYVGDSGFFSSSIANTGAGGSGGHGAGGAGAGIGGGGGFGGAGGAGGGYKRMVYPNYSNDENGNAGSNGGTGSAGVAMGTLYVLGSVSVVATGGGSTPGSGGGNPGSYTYKKLTTSLTFYHTLSGGGGGGGGGSTLSAAAIGGGSGGAGGGGGGGSGASWNITTNWWAHSGYGGYGGYGGSSGATGLQEETCGRRGGGSGGGGGMGNSGSAGTVYKSSTATISGRAANGVATTHSAVASTITFDKQAGIDGTSSLNVVFGCAMGNITLPTKDMHAFMGYYTSPNGQGTRYFDHRGVPLTPYYGTSDITLYAYWVQQQFNVTLNPQSGSGGTASLITTGTDGTLPTGITMPARANYKFDGYYQNAAGQGTQYYDKDGGPTANKITANSTIYASWTQMQYPLSFNQQGGSGGTASSMTDSNDGTLPNITAPTRTGFVFDGYFSAAFGKGTKYYNSDGTPIATQKLTASSNALYAYWTPANYAITYELGGGVNGDNNPTTRNYGNNVTIIDPTKSGYTFVGWTINNGTQTHKGLVIDAGNITYAKDLTLTAKWLLGTTENDTDTVIDASITGSVTNADEIKETLKSVFSYIVAENDKGVTADDMAGDKSIKLVMTVNASQSQDDEADIAGNAQGTVLKFYDLKVEKQVTDSTGNTVYTNLTELPVPVTVKIPTSGDLSGKTAYSVYRVHGSATEKLPSQADVNGEYSDFSGSEIVITTRKFSTYGIVGAETSIGGDATTGNLNHSGQGVDIQGRVIEGIGGKVYKIDIAWGSMVFEYSLQQEWDPEAHMYTEGALNDWRTAGFDGTNNKVTAINHSNGDVKINFAVNSLLSGVTTSMHVYNDKTADEANFFILPDAPVGSTNAELVPCTAYMFLEGPPTNDWINANKDAYAKAGLITVTVEAHPDP